MREKKFDQKFSMASCSCNKSVRLIFQGCQMAKKSTFKIFFFPSFKNWVFSKNGVFAGTRGICSFQGRTALVWCTFGLYIANGRLLTLERQSRKTVFQSDKSVFSDISWPLTSFISRGCSGIWNRLIALMKLFSLGRTVLAVSFQVWSVRIALVEVTENCTMIMLRTSVMVWYLDGPLDRRFAHMRPDKLQTERRRGVLFFDVHFDGTDLKMTEKPHILYSFDELDEPTDGPSKSIHPVFRSNRLRTVRTNCLQSTRYQVVRIV